MARRIDCILAVLALVACTDPGSAGTSSDQQDFGTRERGRYLATAADCAACHTVPGAAPFAGGRAIETPFGTVLAPNITPDRETGIGAWTDDEFVNALRHGTGRDGAHLYPAMPYGYMTKMTRDDVLSIRAYINSVEPVRHSVVANQLPFPFDIRLSMLAWNALFFREGEFHFDPDKPLEWNRGAYLVEGAGHCGACHTPKNMFGGDRSGSYLQGAALQGWFAPNLTNDMRRGLGGWSVDDIAAYLRTGQNSVAAASGPMAEVVSLSSSLLTDADLRAIGTYLKAQPGQNGESDAPLDPGTPAMRAGSAIYVDLCSACHGKDGNGVKRLIPPLKGAPAAQSVDPSSVLRVVLRGARSVATAAAPTGAAMPSFAWQLDDEEVAAVATYVRNAWGNAAPAVSAEKVKQARTALAQRGD